MSDTPSGASARLDVLTVGEPMVLFAAADPGPLHSVSRFVRCAAGAELNVAIGLSRLGLRCGYITRLGQDSFGDYLAGELRREGIDDSYVVRDAAQRTGFMLKSKTDDGSDPQIEYHRAGSAASHLGVDDLPRVFPARHLHLTGITPALSGSTLAMVLELVARARAAGASISFDPNLRPRLWPSQQIMVDTLNRIAALADWILPGRAEGEVLLGTRDPQAIARHYLQAGAQRVVVKLGPQGAWWQDASEGGIAEAIPVAHVVDTVGAGDGFAVGVISALLEGLGLPQAAARGNAIGARVVQFPGDSDGLPTRAQLESICAQPRCA
ncbi:2-dehydro-3-deoxygluconokinase [Lampropedia cohaerens]|uniref:2-dehydro-3-deoxygluconokinase n=2 Tax=Lampropedia cohaerens TaxID=1610491 RepID=A0A0U1PX97_9BURK|nr:2-dehydro-3-deoxygluconokinase [Lampropedia cohaerens]